MRVVPVTLRRTLESVHKELGKTHSLMAGADGAKEVEAVGLLRELESIEALCERLRKEAAGTRFSIERSPLHERNHPEMVLTLGRFEGIRLEDAIASVDKQLRDSNDTLDKVTAEIARRLKAVGETPKDEHKIRQLYEDYGRAVEKRIHLEKVAVDLRRRRD